METQKGERKNESVFKSPFRSRQRTDSQGEDLGQEIFFIRDGLKENYYKCKKNLIRFVSSYHPKIIWANRCFLS